MKAQFETESKGRGLPGFICVLDAKERNAKEIVKYSNAEIIAGAKLLEKVQQAYFRSKAYLNYREKFIAVKVENAQLADKITSEVAELNTWVTGKGYVVKIRGKHIIFHIAKKA